MPPEQFLSWIVGYVIFGLFLMAGVFLFGNQELHDPWIAMLSLIYFLVQVEPLTFYEYLWKIYPGSQKFIPQEKLTGPGGPTIPFQEILFYTYRTRTIVFLPTLIMSYYGLVHTKWNYSNPIPGILEAYAYYFLFLIIRDLTGMLPFHEWMHTKAFKLHSLHHIHAKNVNVIRGSCFDVLDLLIENGTGVLLTVFAVNFIFGVPLPVFTLVFILWHDANTHNINPYTPIHLNPIMDYLLRDTLAHSLHHAIGNSNYLLCPWHHLLPGKRDADIKKYNEIMKTTVY